MHLLKESETISSVSIGEGFYVMSSTGLKILEIGVLNPHKVWIEARFRSVAPFVSVKGVWVNSNGEDRRRKKSPLCSTGHTL